MRATTRRPALAALLVAGAWASTGCLEQGTEVTVSVTSMAPAPSPAAPGTSAPSLPTGDEAPTLGRRLRTVDGAVATATTDTGILIARPGRLDLLGRGGPARLVRLDGTPLAVVVPDPARPRAVVLLREDGASVVRSLAWSDRKAPTGRLGAPVAAGDAVLLTAAGTPISVDASALSADPSATVTPAVALDGDRVWAAAPGAGTIQLGVGTIVGSSVTIAPVAAWNTTERPTAVLPRPEDAALWIGTDAGRLWRLDVDGDRAGNPVGYPLVDGSVEALLDRGPVFWLTASGRTVEVDPGVAEASEPTAAASS